MFERYTEKARRTIFFARVESSKLGGPFIESEHLLLGLLTADKSIFVRYLGDAESGEEQIREAIVRASTAQPPVSTSVDLPLSNECKHILAYAADEAEKLEHHNIDTDHLLLGILREDTASRQDCWWNVVSSLIKHAFFCGPLKGRSRSEAE
jgi:ATP-dependent Clp protease ATP-binding subunit ClpC